MNHIVKENVIEKTFQETDLTQGIHDFLLKL